MAVENLDPVRTKEEARERGRKGGIASGIARREKKTFRQTLEALLVMPMKDGKDIAVDDIKNFAAIKGKNISVQEAILISQIQKAMKGDTRAAEYVRDTIGQQPKDIVSLEAKVSDPFEGLTTEELKKLIQDD